MNSQKVIGIVGGGQLGRMLTLAALPLGFRVVVVDPNENCSAAQVGAEQIKADLYDEKALRQLAKKADYITVEIEHLDTTVLEALSQSGAKIQPSPATIKLIQDKYQQKQFLQKNKVPVAQFVEITDRSSAESALKKFGGKMLIKTRYGAYDGRGNMVVSSAAEAVKALEVFEGKKLYAEKLVPFIKELAVMVARDKKSNIKLYPIVETIHERNICTEVLAPAAIDKKLIKKAEAVAKKVAGLLKGAGTFGIEMFLTPQGKILVNEIAPRVHNNGHLTIEACRTSQFEQHIRAISGLPLGSTEMIVPSAAMINILGERNGPVELQGVGKVLEMADTSLHLYGKSPTKVDRKMGHITVTADNVKAAQKRARQARKLISI